MKTKKLLNKAFAMLLALVMVVTLVPVNAKAAEEKTALESYCICAYSNVGDLVVDYMPRKISDLQPQVGDKAYYLGQCMIEEIDGREGKKTIITRRNIGNGKCLWFESDEPITDENINDSSKVKRYTNADFVFEANKYYVAVYVLYHCSDYTITSDTKAYYLVDRTNFETAECSYMNIIYDAYDENSETPEKIYNADGSVKQKTYKAAAFKFDKTCAQGQWKQSNGRWWYEYSDGSYAVGNTYIDEKWYRFDNDGWMITGWVGNGQDYVYYGEDGAMMSGWLYLDEKWYYLEPGEGEYDFSEAGMGEWLLIDGAWYYFDWNCEMMTGWFAQRGKSGYFPSSGEATPSWINDENVTWYYLTSSGAMATGWVLDGTTWYYMNQSGEMQTGWIYDGGEWYYLTSSGAMATGWVLDGTTWYYMYSSGAMAHDTVIDGYVLNSSGAWVQ